jgi:hypothetical protein
MEKLNQTSVALEVKQGMARAFFISAYADAWEEADDSSENKRQLGSVAGLDWAVFAPKENDPAAQRAADELEVMLKNDNGATDLAELYHRAMDAKELCQGDKDMNPHNFGHYLAMQAMGHGVGLADAFGDAVYDMVKVAYLEFGYLHLDREYF